MVSTSSLCGGDGIVEREEAGDAASGGAQFQVWFGRINYARTKTTSPSSIQIFAWSVSRPAK